MRSPKTPETYKPIPADVLHKCSLGWGLTSARSLATTRGMCNPGPRCGDVWFVRADADGFSFLTKTRAVLPAHSAGSSSGDLSSTSLISIPPARQTVILIPQTTRTRSTAGYRCASELTADFGFAIAYKGQVEVRVIYDR